MFHLTNGIFFERVKESDVRIVLTKGKLPADAPIWEITVPENEWASVVASVSTRGETSDTWRLAREFHLGRCVE